MTRNTARTRTEWQTVLQIYCGLEVVDSMRNHRAPSWYESSLELRRCSVSYCLKPLEPSAVAADKHTCVRASSSTSMNPIFEHLICLLKPLNTFHGQWDLAKTSAISRWRNAARFREWIEWPLPLAL